MALEDTENRWESRVWQARILRFLIFMAPVIAAVAAAVIASQLLFVADTTFGVILWWASLIGIAISAMLLVDRLARKALPLAFLMQMTMLFPDKAPTRMKMVRLTGSTKRLEERLEDAKEQGALDVVDNAENVLALAAALNAHDRLTRGHSERVRVFVDLIAEELEMEDDDRDRLRWAALLHDVGKLDVHPDILNKDGRPTDEEWHQLRSHPIYGAELLGPLLPWLGDWAGAVEHHHEKYDGTGYPAGLAGEEISLAGRIVSVGDAYDAITSARSYKKPISAHTAREELARSAGTHFDPAIVRAFLGISLGKIRWVIGPASWFAQIPFIGGLNRIGKDLAILGAAALVLLGAIQAGFVDTPAAVAAEPPTTTIVAGGGDDDGGTSAGDAPADSTTSTSTSTTTSTSTSTTSTTTSSTSTTSTTTTSTTTTTVPATTTTTVAATTTTTLPPLRPPVVGNEVATTAEDASVVVAVLANDSDPDGDPISIASYDARSAFGGDIVCSAGSCTYTPAADFNGVDSFSYVVSDGKGGLSAGTVTVTVTPVNDGPIARADAGTTTVDTALAIYVLVNDSDPEGQQRTIVAFDTSSAQGGTVACEAACVYTPPAGFVGTDSFSYTIADTDGLTSTATVTVTVN